MARRRREGGLVAPLSVGNAASVRLGRAVGGHPRIQAKVTVVADPIRLLDIRDRALDVAEVYDVVQTDSAGGVALFVGTVRDHDGGNQVARLGYSAHPTASDVMRQVTEKVVASHDVQAVAAVHRVGDLEVGDIAVVVAVSCAHRGNAFLACQALIDDLKSQVPIWKHQVFADGTDEWVGTP
jgi:molybdopterin synthase catalytic subunit